MTTKQEARGFGRQSEHLAERHLLRKGYRLVARNVRLPQGEVDLIVQQGSVLVFVEVKVRRSRRCGSAVEAIRWRKRRRIAAMALDYLARQSRGARCRFDVVAIDSFGTASESVRVIRNAFLAYER